MCVLTFILKSFYLKEVHFLAFLISVIGKAILNVFPPKARWIFRHREEFHWYCHWTRPDCCSMVWKVSFWPLQTLTNSTNEAWMNFWKNEINMTTKVIRRLVNSGNWKWMKIARFWTLLTWKTPETYEISWLLHLNQTLRNFLFSKGKVVILNRVVWPILFDLVIQSGVFSILLLVYV